MPDPHDLLADPWNDLPGHGPYEDLAPIGVGSATTMDALCNAYFDLMERGQTDEAACEAFGLLQVVPRRLVLDATRYDPQAAAELLEFLMDLPEFEGGAEPLQRLIRFTWDA